MKFKDLNNITSEIEGFYRVSIDLTRKYSLDSELAELIPKWANNKKKFYDNHKKNFKITTSTNIIAFFSKVLVHSEVILKKDLIEFNVEECIQMVRDLALFEGFATKSMYESYVSILQHYTRWGYNHEPKLRNDIIKTTDLPFNYAAIIDRPAFDNKILTRKRMLMTQQAIDHIMVDTALSLCEDGFGFKEILDIEINDIKNCQNQTVNINGREIKLSTKAYEKALEYANTKEMLRQYKNGSKMQPLIDTKYLMRTTKTAISHPGKVTKHTLSYQTSKELGYAEYDGSFKDWRNSSMLNDFLDWIEEDPDGDIGGRIDDKYDLRTFSTNQFKATYKLHLKVLRDKRNLERQE